MLALLQAGLADQLTTLILSKYYVLNLVVDKRQLISYLSALASSDCTYATCPCFPQSVIKSALAGLLVFWAQSNTTDYIRGEKKSTHLLGTLHTNHLTSTTTFLQHDFFSNLHTQTHTKSHIFLQNLKPSISQLKYFSTQNLLQNTLPISLAVKCRRRGFWTV